MFLMHCNPTHYLNMHEGGHRLSFGHAEILVTDDGFKAPTDPLTTGQAPSKLATGAVGYTDETDIMACCHGDYSVYAKLEAGFIRGRKERAMLSKSDLAARQSVEYELCPYDRAECRGMLMALTMRPSDDTTLTVGNRSMPFWPDLEIEGLDRSGQVVTRNVRDNLAGLSIIKTKLRGTNQDGNTFYDRSLLNFNSLFGTFPEGLQRASQVCRHERCSAA